jgi:hypothetical protein
MCRQPSECASEDQLPELLESSTVVSMSVQGREIPPNSRGSSSLHFGDDGDNPPASARTQQLSSTQAVLELLKEESDLLEDDDEPMSFLKPALSLRKGV